MPPSKSLVFRRSRCTRHKVTTCAACGGSGYAGGSTLAAITICKCGAGREIAARWTELGITVAEITVSARPARSRPRAA